MFTSPRTGPGWGSRGGRGREDRGVVTNWLPKNAVVRYCAVVYNLDSQFAGFDVGGAST